MEGDSGSDDDNRDDDSLFLSKIRGIGRRAAPAPELPRDNAATLLSAGRLPAATGAPGGSEDGEAGDVLGPLRARLEAEGKAADWESVGRAAQISLDRDDAFVREGLEDSTLTAHVAQARRNLVLSGAPPPTAESAARAEAKARKALSALLTGWTDKQMDLQRLHEEVLLHAQNALRLSAGEQPHGFPALVAAPDAAFGDCLRKLGAQCKQTGKEFAELSEFVGRFVRDLTTTRRDCELAIEDYKALAKLA